MQVILLEKVANLGNLGDVVKVKDGFARNFLIPTRRARRATEPTCALHPPPLLAAMAVEASRGSR